MVSGRFRTGSHALLGRTAPDRSSAAHSFALQRRALTAPCRRRRGRGACDRGERRESGRQDRCRSRGRRDVGDRSGPSGQGAVERCGSCCSRCSCCSRSAASPSAACSSVRCTGGPRRGPATPASCGPATSASCGPAIRVLVPASGTPEEGRGPAEYTASCRRAGEHRAGEQGNHRVRGPCRSRVEAGRRPRRASCQFRKHCQGGNE